MPNTLPSEMNPLLEENLINIIGQRIADCRLECLDEFNEGKGDTSVSQGMRNRDWAIQGVRELVQEDIPGAGIIKDERMLFIGAINGVPYKIFRDDPKEPVGRALKGFEDEDRQMELLFPDDINNKAIMWRFIVDSKMPVGEVRVVFVGIEKKSKKVVCLYEIPLQGKVQSLHLVGDKPEAAVELPAPQVGPKERREDVVSNG